MSTPPTSRRRTGPSGPAGSRRGFTLVNIVTVMGTLALALALVQTDAVTTTVRRSSRVGSHVRARVLAETALVAYPSIGALSIDRGPAHLDLGPAPAASPVPSGPSGSMSAPSPAPSGPSGPRAIARVRIVSPIHTTSIEIAR